MARRLLMLLACALLVAGCGSSKDESVNGLLKDTFAGGKSVKSGELNVQLDANLQGVQSLKGPVQLRVSGPFQSTGKNQLPKFDFTLAITSNGQTFTAGGTSVGGKGYVSFQNQAYSVSDKLFQQFKNGYIQSQKRSKSKSSAPSLGALGVDPRRWLIGARKAGEADVEGAKTIHITAGIDVPRLLGDINRVLAKASSVTGGAARNVPQNITPAQQKQIEDAVQTARVDVYTGKKDHALRKLDVFVQLKKGAKVQGGSVHFNLTLAQLNQKQSITAPSNAKPLDQLLAQLQGSSAGGTTGGATTTAPGTTTPGATPSAGGANSQYLQCLQSAGQDVRQVQKCAALLK